METDDQQGFPAKKVVAGAALGVAVPAAVAVAKKLVGGNSDDGDETHEQEDAGARDEPISRERKQTGRTTAKKQTRRTTAKKQAPRTTAKSTRTRTREQLYKQATRLKIEGRSAMNKEQLERAVNRAKQKASR